MFDSARPCKNQEKHSYDIFFFFKLEFTASKAEQPLQGTELQENKIQKD